MEENMFGASQDSTVGAADVADCVIYLCALREGWRAAAAAAFTCSWSAVKLVRALLEGLGWLTSCSVGTAPSMLTLLPADDTRAPVKTSPTQHFSTEPEATFKKKKIQ